MSDLNIQNGVALGYGTVVADTGVAIRVELENKAGETYLLWIPKACLHEDSEVHEAEDEGEVHVLRWWADKEGLEDQHEAGAP